MWWRSYALWFTRQWAASFEGGKRNLSLWAEYKPLVAAGNKVQLFVSTLQCIPLILSAEPWTGISWVLLRSLNSFLLFLSDLKECNGQTIKCAVGSCGHSYVQTSLHMMERCLEHVLCLKHWQLSIWQADFITLKTLLRNEIKKNCNFNDQNLLVMWWWIKVFTK